MFTKEIVQKIQQHQTPFYYYDLDLLNKTLAIVNAEREKYGYHVHYAFKANANPLAVLLPIRKPV